MGKLIPLDFPPGIVRDETQYRAEGRWWDCDKVRFRNGRPEMIGGWKRVSSTLFNGVPRDLHSQTSRPVAAGTISQMVFAGTSRSVYYGILSTASSPVSISFTELTPESFSFSLSTDPFTSVGGSVTYLYAQMSGRVRLLDAVTISGGTTFAGISTGELNRLYIVTELNVSGYPAGTVKLESYTVPYVSAGTGGGASVTATVSMATGTYSSAKQWSFASRGGDCVMCLRDNALFYQKTDLTSGNPGCFFLCEASTSYPATAANDDLTANSVPRIARGVTVGKDSSVIAFGCSDGDSDVQDLMNVRWSDQDNPYDWEPREDNTAGGFRMDWGSEILSWLNTKREILIWTDTAVVSMKWVGAPYYYSFEKIADNTSCLTHGTAIAVGDEVFWMGSGQFYRYNGAVQSLPCTVQKYVFSNLNTTVYPIRAGLNPAYNEVWWMYPANENTALENDHYVIFNYVENVWSIGTMARSAWLSHGIIETGAPGALILASDGSYMVAQEYGYSDDNGTTQAVIPSYVESGTMDIGEGDVMQFCSTLIPNHSVIGAASDITYTIKGRDWPNAELYIEQTVNASTRDTKKDIRIRAREFAVRVGSAGNDFKWNLGKPRIEIQPDGRR